MMRVQNKETLKGILLWSGMVVCLFLAGCQDKPVEHFNRGNAYGAKGYHDRAISDYTKAIEINPRYAEAYCLRGATYTKKGEYDRAISDLTEALKINPRYAEPYYFRGVAYGKKGEYDKAVSDFNKALVENTRYAKAFYGRGVIYCIKGEYDKAWEDVHKAQSSGYQVHPGFLKALREASGRER